jgi:cbb3-type cytochrome oxidase maturation protein
MSVIFLLIPLSILIAAVFLGAFIWSVRSGQYEDTCTPSMRVLTDDLANRRNDSNQQKTDQQL